MHCNPDFPADIIPVDVAMNAIIVAAWERGCNTESKAIEFRNVVSNQLINSSACSAICRHVTVHQLIVTTIVGCAKIALKRQRQCKIGAQKIAETQKH